MASALEAGLVGRDEGTLLRFYADGLGFTLVDRLEADVGVVCKLRRDAARLKIFFPNGRVDAVTEVEPWFRPGGWRYAALGVDALDEVDAVAAAVVAAGGRIVLPATSHRPGARMALVTDPEGNAWEVLAEPDVTAAAR
jgi:catechol 2,3-dioxygenase-like lactoylglutathione lyase family enzyme